MDHIAIRYPTNGNNCLLLVSIYDFFIYYFLNFKILKQKIDSVVDVARVIKDLSGNL